MFQDKVLPALLRLQDDRVVNVRVALAQAVEGCMGHDSLVALPEVGACAERLLQDEDGDVRDAASKAMANV